MIKKEYMKPTMTVNEVDLNIQILAGSVDANGMNKTLIDDEEVDVAWSRRRGNNVWSDDEEEEW